MLLSPETFRFKVRLLLSHLYPSGVGLLQQGQYEHIGALSVLTHPRMGFPGNLFILRTCAKWRHLGTISRQSGQNQSCHGEIDKGLTTGVRALKIAREPTVARDPGIGAFDYPSSGKDMKALGNDLIPVDFHSNWRPRATNACPGVFDDLEANPKVFFDPVFEFADH
jgi:hypothetical protein